MMKLLCSCIVGLANAESWRSWPSFMNSDEWSSCERDLFLITPDGRMANERPRLLIRDVRVLASWTEPLLGSGASICYWDSRDKAGDENVRLQDLKEDYCRGDGHE
jgi:hypothetical protein